MQERKYLIYMHMSFRDLLFTNPDVVHKETHEPVSLLDITSFQCLTDPLRQSQDGMLVFSYILPTVMCKTLCTLRFG